MSEYPETPPLPTLSDIFNFLLDWYRDPKTGKKLKITEVAMRTPGVKIDMLYSIRNGRRENVGYEVIEAIADAFDVPTDVLFPRRWKRGQFIIPDRDMEGFPPFPRPEAYMRADRNADPMDE